MLQNQMKKINKINLYLTKWYKVNVFLNSKKKYHIFTNNIKCFYYIIGKSKEEDYCPMSESYPPNFQVKIKKYK